MGHVLNNPDVAAKYEAAFDKDRNVTLQGTYSGPLSNITLEAADLLVKQESNLLVAKGSKAAAPPAPVKEKEK